MKRSKKKQKSFGEKVRNCWGNSKWEPRGRRGTVFTKEKEEVATKILQDRESYNLVAVGG